MTFIEFVAFVITLAVMIFVGIKRFFEATQQRSNPEEYARKEKEREENLRKLLKTRGTDLGMKERGQFPKKTVKPSLQIGKTISKPNFEIKPAESYEVIRREKISEGNRLISSLKSPRDMFVIKEILDKPLSMREP